MATLAQFKVEYPEIAGSNGPGDTLLQAFLDSASLQINTTVWGRLRDEGIYCLAAILLAESAFGEAARLSDDKSMTAYQRRFQRMQKQVTIGFRNA